MADQHLPLNSTHSDVARNSVLAQAAVFAFTVVMLMACWAIFVWFGISSFVHEQPTPKPEPNPPPNATSPVIINEEPPPPQRLISEEAYSAAEQKLLLKLQQSEFTPRLDSLVRSLTTARQLESAWSQRFERLQTNDDGRRLATDQSARRIKFLAASVSETADDLNRVSDWLDGTQRMFAEARRPIPELDNVEESLLDVESHLATGIQSLEQSAALLDNMLATTDAPGSRTLKAALDTLDQEAVQQITNEVTSQMTTLETSLSKELKTATDRKDQLSKDLEEAQARLKNTQTESDRQLAESTQTMESDAKRLADRKAEAKRRMEAELPKVRSLLSPFISSGYRQPYAGTGLVVTSNSEPMSFSQMIRVRALEESDKGIEILFRLGDHDSTNASKNDRPAGTFPDYTSEYDIKRPEIIETLKTVQQFLRQHGEAMVEAKLLSP